MRRKILLLALTLFLSSSCISCSKAFDKKPDEKDYIMSPPINIPNLHLNYFSKGRKDLLFRYLASSSKWHVTSIKGEILALKRESSSGPCIPESLGLPSEYPGGEIPFPGGDFFDFSPEMHKGSYLPPQTRVDEDTTTPLKMVKRYYIKSLLIVEDQDKSINLVIGESSNDINRKETHKTLIDISRQLDKLANSKSANHEEIDPSILPPGSVKYSKNQIVSIKKGELEFSGFNRYTVSGYINLGKKGFVYVKVIYKKTREEIFADTSSTNAQYVGWSNDPNKKFNFCIGIHPEGTVRDKPSFLADVQLWFHPSDGDPESMISQQTILLDVREH